MVVVTEHAMQELVAKAQCTLVIDFARAFIIGQVDLASQRAGLTIPLQDREPMAMGPADVTPVEMAAKLVLQTRELVRRDVEDDDTHVAEIDRRFEQVPGERRRTHGQRRG